MADIRSNWVRVFASLLLVGVSAYVLYRVRGVLVTVLLALVMTYILRPLVDQFSRLRFAWRGGRSFHLPRAGAVAFVFVLLAIGLWCVSILSADSVRRQLQEFQTRWPAYRAALMQQVTRVEAYRRDLPPALRDTADTWAAGMGDSVTSGVKRGLSATARSVGMLVELFLVPILTFYFLADGRNIRQQVLFFVPRRYLAWTDHTLTQADGAFARFIKAQVILCLIAFVVVTAGLRAISLDFYLLLGVIAGLTRAIPIVGPIVGAIPILAVVLLAKPLSFAVWVIVLFALLHLLESKLLMPAVLGRQLNLHPVLIIVALLIGAQVGGVLGMFLAAPVLAVIRLLVAEHREAAPREEEAAQPV